MKPESVKSLGIKLLIVGLIAEAAILICMSESLLERGITAFFTLMIALGVWIEEVGAHAIEMREHAENERIRARIVPRHINEDEFKRKLNNVTPLELEIMCDIDDAEARQLGMQLAVLFSELGWKAEGPLPIPPVPDTLPLHDQMPRIMAVGGQSTGITLVKRLEDKQSDLEYLLSTRPEGKLFNALNDDLGDVCGAHGNPRIMNAPASGVLRIVIGSKP